MLVVLFVCAFLREGTAGQSMAKMWKSYYPLDDPAGNAYVEKMLPYAIKFFGSPIEPVVHVNIRVSVPLDRSSNLPSHFASTGIADAATGTFTIYLQKTLAIDPEIYGQLAHEIAHLLNARLYDVYVEGLCTVFAEKAYSLENKDWVPWCSQFLHDEKSMYFLSYHMMREIWAAVGDAAMHNFLSYAVYNMGNHDNMHIDINGWIASLELSDQVRVKTIINRYASDISKLVNVFYSGSDYHPMFLLPADS